MTSIEITGFLACFDLLGFSELIVNTGFNEKFDVFCTILEEAVVSGWTDIHYRFFSDSVVIYKKKFHLVNLLRLRESYLKCARKRGLNIKK